MAGSIHPPRRNPAAKPMPEMFLIGDGEIYLANASDRKMFLFA
jgi:hypothetical protein